MLNKVLQMTLCLVMLCMHVPIDTHNTAKVCTHVDKRISIPERRETFMLLTWGGHKRHVFVFCCNTTMSMSGSMMQHLGIDVAKVLTTY